MDKFKANPEIEISFGEILSFAEKTFEDCQNTESPFITVIKTGKGQIHAIVSKDAQSDEKILQTMIQHRDTKVEYIATFWKVGCLDIPSFGLREKLIALNKENLNALLLLQGEGCYLVRTIESTMP